MAREEIKLGSEVLLHQDDEALIKVENSPSEHLVT